LPHTGFKALRAGRILNVEGRNSTEFYTTKRQSAAIPSFEILRFDILRFCGSLFAPAWKMLTKKNQGL
jgi:hypothetical protein